MLKHLYYSAWYSTLITFRVKQAVFFTFFFPLALYLVFSNIWGGAKGDPAYPGFLLSGLVGITVCSNGIMGVGVVLKDYYVTGMFKYLSKIPLNMLVYFSGVIISRLLIFIGLIIGLGIIAYIFFQHLVTVTAFLWLVAGSLAGLFIFVFLGLSFSFIGIKKPDFDKGLHNMAYFIMVFTSDAFYKTGDFNSVIKWIGDALPLNPVLSLLRGNGVQPMLFVWLVISAALFSFLFRRQKLNR